MSHKQRCTREHGNALHRGGTAEAEHLNAMKSSFTMPRPIPIRSEEVQAFIVSFQDFLHEREIYNWNKARQCAQQGRKAEERECLTWARSAHDARILLEQHIDKLLTETAEE